MKPEDAHEEPDGRGKLLAIRRGFLRQCPNCGKGRIFAGLLRFVSRCAVCGEPLGDIRADDIPAYLTILVTGHVVVPLMLIGVRGDYSGGLVVGGGMALAALLMAVLLPSFKGAVGGLLWSLDMPSGAPD